jgi:hypothetical protein
MPAPAQAAAGINQQLNFQGRLLTNTGAVVADGNYNMRFKIYTGGTGTTAGDGGVTPNWIERWENQLANPVVVKNGYFSVALGSTCAFTGGSCQGNTNTAMDWNQDTLWLSMDVGGTAAGAVTYTNELLPMRRLSSAVYAFQADNAGKLGGLAASAFAQLSAANTFQPAANVTGVVVKQNTQGSPTADIFNVQTQNATNVLQVTGPAINEAAVLLQSVGATRDLTLASGRDIILSPTSGIIKRTAAGTTTIDLNDGSATILNVTNSGAGAASLTVDASITAGTTVITPLVQTADSAASSAAITFRSGNSTNTSTTSGTVTIKSGDATNTNGSSGNITIDVGAKGTGGTAGTIGIGSATTGAVSVTSGGAVAIQGGAASSFTTTTGNTTVDSAGVLNLGTSNATSISVGRVITGNPTNLNVASDIVATGVMNLTGTVTNQQYRLQVGGTLNSGSTGNQYGIQNNISFNPSGASLTNIWGYQTTATVSGSALNITQLVGANISTATTAGYTGQIAEIDGLSISQPSLAGSQLTPNFYGIQVPAVTSGAGHNSDNASSTITNTGIRINSNTAAAAGGTLNNYGIRIDVPQGIGTGTTTNYGLYFSNIGNGTGSNKYAIYDDSDANVLFRGIVNLGKPGAGGVTGNLVFNNATNAFTSTIQGNTSASASYTSILPAAVGSAGQCLALSSVVTTTQTLGYAACGGSGADLQLSNLTGTTSIPIDLTFAAADRKLTIAAPGSAGAGNKLTVLAATGNGANNGGDLVLQAGTSGAGATGNGGNTSLVGGNANSTNGSGGTITISGGSKTGSGTAGGVIIKPQANGNSATAFQIQDASSNALFVADTINGVITQEATQFGTPGGVNNNTGRIFSDSFEQYNQSNWNNAWVINGSSSAAMQNSIPSPHSGNWYVGIQQASGQGYIKETTSNAAATEYARVYISMQSQSSASLELMSFTKGATSYTVNRDSSGNLTCKNGNTGLSSANSSQTLATGNTWHKLEMAVTLSASATGSCQVWLDNTSVINYTGVITGAGSFDGFILGDTQLAAAAHTGSYDYDDLAIDLVRPGDSSGVFAMDTLHVGGLADFGDGLAVENNRVNTLTIAPSGNLTTTGVINVAPLAFNATALTLKQNYDVRTLGGELYPTNNFNSGWTGTPGLGWTTSPTTTQATHTAGTTALVNTSVAISIGATYQISFTLSGCTTTGTDSLTLKIGGNTFATMSDYDCTSTHTYVGFASSTVGMTFTPTTGWNGTISNLSLKQIVGNSVSPALAIQNASGANAITLQADADGGSIYLGVNSGVYTAGGTDNTAVGNTALNKNSTGNYNVAIGASALSNNTDGTDNSGLGRNVLASNSSGSFNIAEGNAALYNNTTGDGNTAIGFFSGFNNIAGNNNTAIGYYAGYQDSTGNFTAQGGATNTTAIGAYALAQSSYSVVLGSVDLATTVGIGTTVPGNLLTVSPVDYQAGTASNSGTAVTGVGTAWTAAMIGETFVFGDGTNGVITAVGSGTSITLGIAPVNHSAGWHYRIHRGGFQVTSGGTAFLQNTSTTEFQVQNTAGKNVLTVDTSGNSVILGKTGAGGITGSLVFNNATNAFTSTIQGNTSASASYTSILPGAVGTAGQCLTVASVVTTTQTLGYGACSGGGGASVTLNNLTSPTSINQDLTFAAADHLVTTTTSGSGVGNNLTVQAATGFTNFGGGITNVFGGAGNGSGNGGNVVISGGLKGASGTGGGVIIKPQTGGDTATAFQLQDASGNNLLAADTTRDVLLQQTTMFGNIGNAQARTGHIWSDDFETGDSNFGNWSPGEAINVSGSSNIQTGTSSPTPRSGLYEALVQIVATNGNAVLKQTTTDTNTTQVLRAYVNMSQTTGTLEFMNLATSTNTIALSRNTAGTLVCKNNGATMATSASTMSANVWHKVEMSVSLSATTGSCQVWVDNTSFLNATSQNTGVANFNSVSLGDTLTTEAGNINFDDVSLDRIRTGDASGIYATDTLHVGGLANFGQGLNLVSAGSTVLQASTGGNLTFSGGQTIGVSTTNSGLTLQANGTGTLLLGATGAGTVNVKTSTNSATALTVTNTGNNAVLTVDTSGNNVVIGKASSITGNLQFANSTNANLVTVNAQATTAAYSMALPLVGSSGAQCLQGTAGSTTTVTVLIFSSCGSGSGLAKNAADTSTISTLTVGQYLYGFSNTSTSASGVLKIDNSGATGNGLYVTASTNPAAGSALLYVENKQGAPSGNLIDLHGGSSTPPSVFSVDYSGRTTITGGTTFGGNLLSVVPGITPGGGNGNAISLQSANGGNSAAAGGSGGAIGFTAGNGGQTTSSGNGGAAGNISLTAGAGGTGTSGFAGAVGGAVTIQGGAGGNNGTTGAVGGAVYLMGGAAGTGGVVAAGSVYLGYDGTTERGANIVVGNSTTNATETLLQLDSANTAIGSSEGTCTTTTNQGALYFNTTSAAIRSCVNGAWEDVVTTAGLGLLLFGVVPDSGTNPGDLPSLQTAAVTGPCKVSASTSSTTQLVVQGCILYSGGRKIVQAATTVTISGTTINQWAHLCYNTSGALTLTPAATQTASLPWNSVNNPLVCLADINISGTVNVPVAVYDTRTFTNADKEVVSSSAALALGTMVTPSGNGVVSTVATTANQVLRGVVVASTGAASVSNAPAGIIVVSGSGFVKATAGSQAAIVISSSGTAGYALTGAASATAYANLGYTRVAFPLTACTAGVAGSPVNCDRSLYVQINIK